MQLVLPLPPCLAPFLTCVALHAFGMTAHGMPFLPSLAPFPLCVALSP